MMKQIQQKYSKSKLEYNKLDIIPFKILKEVNDNYYTIIQPEKIRRNLSWRTEPIIEQKILFDLNELCLLSKIHIYDANVMKLDLEIAKDIEGPFIKIQQEMEIVSGKVRILKIGSLPCRYFRIKIKKGCPIMDFKKIECYGLLINEIKNKYDEETLDILFYNTYDIIYSN